MAGSGLRGEVVDLLEGLGVLGEQGVHDVATGLFLIDLSDDLADSINRQDVAVCDLNEVVDYYRLSADKRLLYGGACNYSGRDPKSIRDYIEPRMLKTYPQLKGTGIDFEWGGKIGIVPNRVLAVGRINGLVQADIFTQAAA